MNPRHAAVLLIVVWLMTPLFGDDYEQVMAPLARWDIAGTYNSQAECLQKKKELVQTLKDNGWPPMLVSRTERVSQCVQPDDPALDDPPEPEPFVVP